MLYFLNYQYKKQQANRIKAFNKSMFELLPEYWKLLER